MTTVKYSIASSPYWANADHSCINLTVKFDHLPAPVPFSASPNDPEPHGRELFERALKGDFGPIS